MLGDEGFKPLAHTYRACGRPFVHCFLTFQSVYRGVVTMTATSQYEVKDHIKTSQYEVINHVELLPRMTSLSNMDVEGGWLRPLWVFSLF